MSRVCLHFLAGKNTHFFVRISPCSQAYLPVRKCKQTLPTYVQYYLLHLWFNYLPSKKQASSQLSDDSDEDEDSDSPGNIFLSAILTFLLKVHNSRDKAVRYRACQLISKIFENMGEDATINEEIAETILTTMLERVCDKIPVVRCQAVCALARLQDPLDSQCPVIAAYVYLMSSDSSGDVRKTVLYKFAITKLTLPHIIGMVIIYGNYTIILMVII